MFFRKKKAKLTINNNKRGLKSLKYLNEKFEIEIYPAVLIENHHHLLTHETAQ